jgi:hypothetical protein
VFRADIPRMRSLVLASLVALTASGCSSLASTPLRSAAPRPESPRLSHAELVPRAQAACAKRTRALAALARPRTKTDRRAFFAAVASIERAEAEALASLRPPRRDEREFARLVTASIELAEISERFLLAVVRDNVHERRRALADADRASAAYDRAARRLRLTCRQSA